MDSKYTPEQLRDMAQQVLAVFPDPRSIQLVIFLTSKYGTDPMIILEEIQKLAQE